MARIDLPEPYAIRMARRNVRESLMAHGEEVIAFSMYHAHLDEGIQPRCPVCFDDIYNQGETWNCSACFGTTFKDGIKAMSRAWALLTETPQSEQKGRRGEWMESDRDMQMEYSPKMWQNDYIMRVKQWSQDHRPLELGEAFTLRSVTEITLRTGNQIGQNSEDVVGIRCRINPMPVEHPIYKVTERGIVRSDFPVLRLDGDRR